MAKGKKKKRPATEDESSSSNESCDDDSPETSKHRRRRSQERRNTSKKERAYSQGKEIERLLAVVIEEMHKQSKQATESKEEVRKQLDMIREEMCQQSKQAIESKEDICKQLKQVEEDLTEFRDDLCKQLGLHTNGTSDDAFDAPRSQSNQVQTPRYRLVFKSGVAERIEKDKIIETSVALVDGYNNDQTVENGPLASVTVELVVVNAEFNQHNNLYNWSREDFESNIKKARQGNTATVDVDHQSVKSIVSDGRFNLVQGFKCHGGSRIFSNSGNKKVRLGVMVVSPTEERVLEGLSNPFFVRGHDRPARQSNLRHNRSNTQNRNVLSSSSGMNTTTKQLQLPFVSSGLNINEEQQLLFLRNTPMLSAEPSTSQEQRASIQHYHFPHLPTMAQEATNNQIDELSSSTLVGHLENPNYMGNSHVPVHEVGMQFSMDQRVLPVQLLWDRPNVELSKRRWDLVDQLITPPQKHFGSLSLASIQKSVVQTRPESGVLIEPLEPDYLDEQRPLKRKRHSKYQLRFVNKVCEAYYTRDQIKADDGNLIMVSLFDENNTKINYGPLSSASVEVVALHGDFNVDGQDYWTSEEFSRSVVSPPPGEEASSVIGGDLILVLAGGEACLRDAFFQRTSFSARTEKFKMGVMLLASAEEERIQEGISEPFRVIDRGVEELPGRDGDTTDKAPPPGFRFHPTDNELIFDYLCHRDAAKSFTVHVIAEVDIYKFDPWDLPAKAVYGDQEWYFFSPLKRYPNSDRPNRAAGSGYWNWKTTGAIPVSASDDKMVGFKKTLVFYTGVPPKGEETGWVMHEYHRLSAKTWGPTTSSSDTEGSSTSTSSMRLDEWVLCRIFRKARLAVQSSYEQGAHLQKVRRLGQQLPEFLSYTDLPPGFRFHPTDKELILDYLLRRPTGAPCRAPVIAEVDIYKFEPWDLPGKAMFGERECYFFHRRKHNYAAGTNANRATESGYWKMTGTDKPITLSSDDDDTTLKTIGFKKALVFYRGRVPRGEKTNWIMHEYRLHDNPLSAKESASSTSSTSDEWLLCRVYKKSSIPDQQQIDHAGPQKMQNDYFSDSLLPPLSTMPSTSSSVSDCITNLTYTPSTPEPPSSPSSLW